MNEYSAGSTSIVETIFLQDSTSTTGAGKASLAFNTAGLTCYYKRSNGTASVVVSLQDITTLGSFVSGGFKAIDNTNMAGLIEFHPPDAAFLAGAKEVTFFFQGATGLAPRPIKFRILAVNPDSATAFVSSVPSVVGGVTVTTNNDKTGYSLPVTPPTAVQIRSEMDSNSTRLAFLTGDAFARIGAAGAGLTALGDTRISYLDALVSSRSTFSGGAVASVSSGVTLAATQSFNNTGQTTKLAATLISTDVTGNLPANVIQWGAVSVTGMPLPASSYTVPPTTSAIHDAIISNANKIAPDSSGYVSTNNFPVEFLTSTEQTELTNAITDLVALLGRTDTAPTVSSIATSISTLLSRLPASLSFTGANVNANAQVLPSPAPSGYGASAGLTGARSVALTFHDAGASLVSGVTFTVLSSGAVIGTAVATGGTKTVGLDDGTYTISPAPTSAVLFTPLVISVDSTHTAFTLAGSTISAPAAPAEANDCVIYVDLEDSLGTETGKIKVEVPPTKLSNTRWVVRSTQTKTVDGSGRITFDPVPRGARVLVTVSAAGISSEFLVPDTATHQV